MPAKKTGVRFAAARARPRTGGPAPTPTATAQAVMYFRSSAEFRRWLVRHHDKERELVVGFYKKASGEPSITYPEALDEALCFGWIDGVRRSVDERRYSQRFTPRRPRSHWSAVNIRRVHEIEKLGRMTAAGTKAFEARDANAPPRYTYEMGALEFTPAMLKAFRANKKGWAFFQVQAPFYQRLMTRYVMSAKQEETRQRRLANVIRHSAKGHWIPQMPGAPRAKRAK